VRLWDVATGQVLRILSDHTDVVNSVAFSPDGKMLASGSDDLTVILSDVATGQMLHSINSEDHVTSVAFSPDGKILAFGDVLKIKLWDVARNEILQVLEGHTQAVTALAFLSDGKTLVSGSIDTTVKLWYVTPEQ
jgi:WD40 repeat protein